VLLRSKQTYQIKQKNRAVLLIVSSANLTKSGWQTNVESVASRILAGDQRNPLVNDVRRLLDFLKQEDRFNRPTYQSFCNEFDDIFRDAVDVTKSLNERLIITGYDTTPFIQQLVNHLAPVANRLRNQCALEIISPYTSSHSKCEPLRELVSATAPKTITVMIPQTTRSVSDWPKDTIDSIIKQCDQCDDSVRFGKLHDAIIKHPDPDVTYYRSVHAKLYRWRTLTGLPLEVTIIGSHNLTYQAFSGNQNIEVSLLLFEHPRSTAQARRWLQYIHVPTETSPALVPPSEEELLSNHCPIWLVFDWETSTLLIQSTDDTLHEAHLIVESVTIRVVADSHLKQIVLSAQEQSAVRKYLTQRSFVTAFVDESLVLLYVEQLNLEQKPWLYGKLSLQEIIYGLTTELRITKIDPPPDTENEKRTPKPKLQPKRIRIDTLSDRLAGLVRVSITVQNKISNARQNGFEAERASKALNVQSLFSKHYPLSLWQYVECLMDTDNRHFSEEDIYIALTALENVISDAKCTRGSVIEYRHWVQRHRRLVNELLTRIQRHRNYLRKTIRNRLTEEGISAHRFLQWLDNELAS
jgi:hypothetical protein